MPAPLPGMDPYLEGYLWPDVHHRLASQISRQLAPQLQPNYVARLEISVIEDTAFTAEVGVMYPDVEVLKINLGNPPLPSPTGGVAVLEAEATLTAPLTISLPQVRMVSVEIRDVAQNQLITSIEILSPVNKRDPHLSQYRLKRLRLHQAGVHLLEIDLLRRGSRPWTHPHIPDTPYLILLSRAEVPAAVEVWPIRLQDRLPILPVPLRHPDKDVPLDLSAALTAVYDEAYYHLSIDYSQEPPPPSLTNEDIEWLRAQVKIEK